MGIPGKGCDGGWRKIWEGLRSLVQGAHECMETADLEKGRMVWYKCRKAGEVDVSTERPKYG